MGFSRVYNVKEGMPGSGAGPARSAGGSLPDVLKISALSRAPLGVNAKRQALGIRTMPELSGGQPAGPRLHRGSRPFRRAR